MDSHRMLTHPDAVPPRSGTQRPSPALTGGQPARHAPPDVLMKNTPIEAVMGGGGAVAVTAPRNGSRPRQMPRPELARGLTPASAGVSMRAPAAPIALSQLVDSKSDAYRQITGSPGSTTFVENTLTGDQAMLCIYLIDEHLMKIQPADAEPLPELELARATVRALNEIVKASTNLDAGAISELVTDDASDNTSGMG
jgi:hypothetical protein